MLQPFRITAVTFAALAAASPLTSHAGAQSKTVHVALEYRGPATGEPKQIGVVTADQRPISGQPNIDLSAIRAARECRGDGGHRVLGPIGGRTAAMRQNQRAGRAAGERSRGAGTGGSAGPIAARERDG
jgi:hypothetical protein